MAGFPAFAPKMVAGNGFCVTARAWASTGLTSYEDSRKRIRIDAQEARTRVGDHMRIAGRAGEAGDGIADGLALVRREGGDEDQADRPWQVDPRAAVGVPDQDDRAAVRRQDGVRVGDVFRSTLWHE